MALEYPRNTIWFVEGVSPDQSRVAGSAVAVWLQKKGEPQTRRKYLLTCAHVVRDTVPGSLAANKEAGFGAILKEIYVYGPDTGYGEGAKLRATVAQDIKPIQEGIIPQADRANAADDWLLLRLEDAQASMAIESVRAWTTADTGNLKIVGYPGGISSFDNNKVIPTVGDDHTFRGRTHGILQLNGSETRPGMSGGGVFDAKDRLVGLHRSRQDGVLQCHAVSIKNILEQLGASGFEFLVPPDNRKKSGILGCVLTISISFVLLLSLTYMINPLARIYVPASIIGRSVDAKSYLKKIASAATKMSEGEYKEYRADLESRQDELINLGTLIIVDIQKADNESYSFRLAPNGCEFIDGSKGLFRIAVPTSILPADFNHGDYRPSEHTYHLVRTDSKIQMIGWPHAKSEGTVIALAEKVEFKGTTKCE